MDAKGLNGTLSCSLCPLRMCFFNVKDVSVYCWEGGLCLVQNKNEPQNRPVKQDLTFQEKVQSEKEFTKG